MATKKTFYEILDIPPNASAQDIQAAHQCQMQALRAEEAQLDHDEFNYRLKLLNLALDTLSAPAMRRNYDTKLASLLAPDEGGRPQRAVAVQPDGSTFARRAEVLALRADSLALRADAIAIQTDAALIKTEDAALSLVARIFAVLKSSIRTVAIILGALAMIQIAFMFFAMRSGGKIAATEAAAEEKIIIQDYYQKYGVRPASAAEARLLEQENQRQEREERAAERDKQRAEEKERRFQEESRRLGERVSADLRHEEQRMRREAEYEKERKREEARRREAEEEARAQRNQDRWRAVLSR